MFMWHNWTLDVPEQAYEWISQVQILDRHCGTIIMDMLLFTSTVYVASFLIWACVFAPMKGLQLYSKYVMDKIVRSYHP